MAKISFYHVMREHNGKANGMANEASKLPQGMLKKNGVVSLLPISPKITPSNSFLRYGNFRLQGKH
jgi:hypothetical protein